MLKCGRNDVTVKQGVIFAFLYENLERPNVESGGWGWNTVVKDCWKWESLFPDIC